MSDIRLSDWARANQLDYVQAHRRFVRGQIPGAFKDKSGHIRVKADNNVIITNTAQSIVDKKMPTINYEYVSLAENINTRSNKSAISDVVNRFANIDQGIVPFYDSSFKGNKSGITVRDAIILINKAYHNFSVIKNIIELLTEFSCGEILFKGGNKKSREFCKAFLKKLGINSFQANWFREYNRSGNVFTYIFKKKIIPSDISKITTVYGAETPPEAELQKGVVLPSRFTILNPIEISVGDSASFLNPVYHKQLNAYEVNRLRERKYDSDKDIYDALPPEIKKVIDDKKTQTVLLPLPTQDVVAVFNAKQPYEALSIPPFFSVLDDLDFKAAMRKMDIATMKLINQAILLVTTGTEPEKGGINPQNIANLTAIFLNESVGRVLIADYTTKAEFVVPPIADILNPAKYEAINNDIYVGLNYILLGDEKFANQASKVQIFIERINHAREIFINEFLEPVIRDICKTVGFKNYPTPYFTDIDLKNDVEWARIYTRLAEIGFITPEEVFNALDNGKLPLPDDSLENQEEFKEQKRKGLYQPITGGPADQMNILKEQNKNALQMQDKDRAHDDKQKTKDRKHASENPQQPAPQIVLNAPTKLAKPNGRPAGSKRPQSTKKVRPLGGSLISGKKIIENVLKADKINHIIIDKICKKFKIKNLNDIQSSYAEELKNKIIRNETPEKWEESVDIYLDKIVAKQKIEDNQDRISAIEELANYHQLDINLAAIVYASLKENDNTNV